jgi:Ran GTPase-activating protein (RanGAP) involved in mRNA processing and transport
MTSDLQALRHLLALTPDEAAWDDLLDLLEAWPDDDTRAVALSYAQTHLAAWPDALRAARPDWLQHPPPKDLGALAKTLTAPTIPLSLRGQGAQDLIDQLATQARRAFLHLPNLTRLSLAGLRMRTQPLIEIILPHLPASLQHLDLSESDLSGMAGTAIKRAEHLPLLRSLDMSRCNLGGKGTCELLAAPCLEQLTYLNLGYNDGKPKLTQALRSAPCTQHLTHLALASNALADKGAAMLADAPLHSLQHLNLSANGLTPTGAQALAAAPWFPQLQHLNLAYNRLTPAGLSALLRAKPSGNLHTLLIPGVQLDHHALAELAEAPLLASLQRLDLNANSAFFEVLPFGDSGLRTLAASPHLTALNTLNLTSNALSIEALAALANAPHLTALTDLNLASCALGLEHLDALLDGPLIARITCLTLFGNALGPELGARLKATHLPRLQHLDLTHCLLNDGALRDLLASPHLDAALTHLHLAWNDLTAAGLDALARAPHLQHLDLLGNPLDDEAADVLASTCPLPCLRVLDLRRTPLNPAGLRALARAPWLPHLRQLLLTDPNDDTQRLFLEVNPRLTFRPPRPA